MLEEFKMENSKKMVAIQMIFKNMRANFVME